jgi:hypothetical protein
MDYGVLPRIPRDCFKALRKFVEQGAFPSIPIHLITPYNTTYCWTVALETRLGTKGDPWLNVYDYLRRKDIVSVVPGELLTF